MEPNQALGLYFRMINQFINWLFGPSNVERELHALHRKVNAIMTTLSDLQAVVDTVSTTLDNIRQDIADIKATLPASGGLTAAEVDALKASLDALSTKATVLDAENPAA